MKKKTAVLLALVSYTGISVLGLRVATASENQSAFLKFVASINRDTNKFLKNNKYKIQRGQEYQCEFGLAKKEKLIRFDTVYKSMGKTSFIEAKVVYVNNVAEVILAKPNTCRVGGGSYRHYCSKHSSFIKYFTSYVESNCTAYDHRSTEFHNYWVCKEYSVSFASSERHLSQSLLGPKEIARSLQYGEPRAPKRPHKWLPFQGLITVYKHHDTVWYLTRNNDPNCNILDIARTWL
jgi:hypothetical protein